MRQPIHEMLSFVKYAVRNSEMSYLAGIISVMITMVMEAIVLKQFLILFTIPQSSKNATL